MIAIALTIESSGIALFFFNKLAFICNCLLSISLKLEKNNLVKLLTIATYNYRPICYLCQIEGSNVVKNIYVCNPKAFINNDILKILLHRHSHNLYGILYIRGLMFDCSVNYEIVSMLFACPPMLLKHCHFMIR